ncbi:PASTA domain-containing protein [Montanilutibacter psychrotolerans]|nr:PASTA domain-containing protein [Lysobacter psychrotolerans]
MAATLWLLTLLPVAMAQDRPRASSSTTLQRQAVTTQPVDTTSPPTCRDANGAPIPCSQTHTTPTRLTRWQATALDQAAPTGPQGGTDVRRCRDAQGAATRCTTVPRVVGMTTAMAQRLLVASGLRGVDRGERASDHPPGTIAITAPVSGTVVAVGSGVDYWTSAAPAPPTQDASQSPTATTPTPAPRDRFVVVPDVQGMHEGQAVAELHERRLTVGTIGEVHEEGTVGIVIVQRPLPGTRVRLGDAIDLDLRRPPQDTTVPPLTGQTEASAQQLLARARLRPRAIGSEPSRLPRGRVIRSAPDAGTVVRVGSFVDYAVASGRNRVPALRALTVEQARAQLARAGFSLGSQATVERPGGTGRVHSQQPAAGSEAVLDSAVNVTLAQSPPVAVATPAPTTPTPPSGPAPDPVPEPLPDPLPDALPDPLPDPMPTPPPASGPGPASDITPVDTNGRGTSPGTNADRPADPDPNPALPWPPWILAAASALAASAGLLAWRRYWKPWPWPMRLKVDATLQFQAVESGDGAVPGTVRAPDLQLRCWIELRDVAADDDDNQGNQGNPTTVHQETGHEWTDAEAVAARVAGALPGPGGARDPQTR